MSRQPLPPIHANRAVRRQNARRPAGRTIARLGLMVSLPGAAVLAATAGPSAVAAAGTRHSPNGPAVPRQYRKESPLVAMRKILENEKATGTLATARPSPPMTQPPPPSTTAPSPPLAAVAAAPPPAPAPRTVSPPPTTVVHAAPLVHPAPVHPAPVVHPAPAPTASHGIVPPANPPSSIAPTPLFETACLAAGPLSPPCVAATLQATDSARAREGLGPMTLPGDYSTLTAAEQLFVLADTERVDRGLPPAVGLVNELDEDALAAASADADPTPEIVPPGVSILRWASNWSENAGALGSNYNWMYDDGPGSGNLACGGGGSGCWGHRDNILGFSAAQLAASSGILVMGAGEAAPAAAKPWMSDTELFAVVTRSPAFYIYTWGQAVASGAH